MLLPDNPLLAADFICWSLSEGIFKTMVHRNMTPLHDKYKIEVQALGVHEFWQKTSDLLNLAYD